MPIKTIHTCDACLRDLAPAEVYEGEQVIVGPLPGGTVQAKVSIEMHIPYRPAPHVLCRRCAGFILSTALAALKRTDD